jgi:hypothetical protein
MNERHAMVFSARYDEHVVYGYIMMGVGLLLL